MLTGRRFTSPTGVVFTIGARDALGTYDVRVAFDERASFGSLEKSSSGHWLLCGRLPAGVFEESDVDPFENACDRAEAEA